MPLVDVPGLGRVEFPEGMSNADMEGAIERSLKFKAGRMALEGTGAVERGVIGAGKAVSDLWQGAKQLVGQASTQEVQEARERDAALMGTTGGKVGHLAGNVLAAVPTMFVPGANTYTGASMVGGAMGLLQPTAEDESRLLNTAVGAGGGLLGQGVAQKLGQWAGTRFANRQNMLATEQAKNALRDATLAEARQAGFVLPPTSVSTSPVNTLLEAVSGKIKTAQAASFKNQEVTNQLARKAVGLGAEDALDRPTLQAIRSQAGDAYEVVASLQSVNWDKSFEKGIKSLAQNLSGGAVKNPAREAIQDLVDGLLAKGAWTGRELVDDIKLLREMGHANKTAAKVAGGDTAKSSLGTVQLKTAQFLEELADRNLALNKAPKSAIQDLRAARELIAKTHSVEKALNEATGNVDAAVLSRELKKGKPLTGELALIARTSRAFPRATQPVESIGSVNPLSAVDAMSGTMLGGLTAAATGHPLGLLAAAAPLARPAARSLILSKPYQRLAVNPPSYRPELTYRMPDALLWNPLLRRSMAPAGAAGLLGYTPE